MSCEAIKGEVEVQSRSSGLSGLGTIAIAAAACLSASLPAHAENHALIMWIGQYADPRANLPGIDLDAKAARRIAETMGVPPANVTELKNEQLALRSMGQALSALVDRIKPGDKVLIYYSGHGAQQPNVSGGGHKCSEGLVAQDVQLYFDRELESTLAKLGAKASQVVMLNDSCFSGGASVKSVQSLVPKVYPLPIAKPAATPAVAGTANDPSYQCGDAVNKQLLKKTIEVVPREGARLLYLAASADNEVSYAGPQGSLATQAWAACLQDPAADTDRSGSINGEELRQCAQARIDRNREGVHQRLSLTGTSTLAVASTAATAATATVLVEPQKALRDLSEGADKAIGVALKTKLPAGRSGLRIGQDALEFDIETDREGYLYVFQVGSDNKTINLLFPNEIDRDNRVPKGRHSFPRASWALKANGPAGTDHLMALLSSTPKDYSPVLRKAGVFASLPATRQAVKTLMVVSTGANAGMQGRYGTSVVVPVEEQQP